VKNIEVAVVTKPNAGFDLIMVQLWIKIQSCGEKSVLKGTRLDEVNTIRH